MAVMTRFGKPNMAALPSDIGREIIDEILAAPIMKLEKKSAEIRAEIKREMERERAAGHSE